MEGSSCLLSAENQEDPTTSYYPQEMIMQHQHTRQLSSMQLQGMEFDIWKREEQHLTNKILVSEHFEDQTSPSPNWARSTFHSTSGILKQDPNWQEDGVTGSSVGLQLRDCIVRSAQVLTLRSLALEIKLCFRLVGDSSLWIFSRGQSVTDPDSAICKVKKDQDSQRIFLIFGAALGENLDFKFLRKQEVPHVGTPSEEGFTLDYTDVKLCFTDNGDDRVIVRSVSKA